MVSLVDQLWHYIHASLADGDVVKSNFTLIQIICQGAVLTPCWYGEMDQTPITKMNDLNQRLTTNMHIAKRDIFISTMDQSNSLSLSLSMFVCAPAHTRIPMSGQRKSAM